MRLSGTTTALVTPFKGQDLDAQGLECNIDYQLERGINGILLLGSTGEAATLSPEEQAHVISIGVQKAKGKVPVWVGTGSNCTRQTIEKTRRAKELGADIALIVTPYYNKPTQEGIFHHFEAVSNAVDIPIVIYNIPGRSGTNIETHTMLRLAGLKNIIGVKEASQNINQAGDVLNTVAKKHPGFLVFSGDDAFTLPLMAMGAAGVVSVVSNLIPKEIVAMTNAALQGDFASARLMHYQLLDLYKAAFLETNPVPIKTAMHLCGMPSGECRLPLYQMGHENLKLLQQVLLQMQLIQI